MAYDIYGQNLRSGHCEVHPDVHEEYPCIICLMGNDRNKQQKMEHDAAMAAEIDAYYAEQEAQHYQDMAYQEIGLPIS